MLYNAEYKAAALFPLRYFRVFIKLLNVIKTLIKFTVQPVMMLPEKEQWLTSNYVLGNDMSLMH
jgi:hypothetical protein